MKMFHDMSKSLIVTFLALGFLLGCGSDDKKKAKVFIDAEIEFFTKVDGRLFRSKSGRSDFMAKDDKSIEYTTSFGNCTLRFSGFILDIKNIAGHYYISYAYGAVEAYRTNISDDRDSGACGRYYDGLNKALNTKQLEIIKNEAELPDDFALRPNI